jgi:hypothetical protein
MQLAEAATKPMEEDAVDAEDDMREEKGVAVTGEEAVAAEPAEETPPVTLCHSKETPTV